MDIEKTKTNPPREKLLHLWNSVHGIVSSFNVGDSKLAEEHERRIRRHYDQLLSNLNVPNVVTKMFKSGKLTAKEHEQLRQFYPTPIRASEELLNIIIINSQDVYECFLESLKKTKQHHVYQMLISDEEIMCIDDQSMSEHSRIIRQNYDWLTEKLDLDSGLLSTLYAQEVLTKREYSQIFFEKEQFAKTENLLSIIIRKSVGEFETFKIALNETSQRHVTKTLETTPVADQPVSEHSRLIRQNYDWLIESLDPDSGLLMTLFSKEVLSYREYGQIIYEKDRFVKNEILLSIISRKSVEDFKKFVIALNDTLQGHITKKLTDPPIGDANQNVTTTVQNTFETRYFESTGKRIPPKPPPKPKKQPPALPSSKPMIMKPKPLLKPRIQLSKPHRLEKRQKVTQHEIVKNRSVDYLEAKLRALPNELQTEVSTKIFFLHRRTLTNSWKIAFTKMLQESRNIKERQNTIQGKAMDEKFERLKHEIIQRERECKMIKEDTERERTKTKEQLSELKETIQELEERLSLTKNENTIFMKKFKACEFKAEGLTALNRQKEQEAIEKVGIIEKYEDQISKSEIKLKEREAQFMDTKDKLIEKVLTSKVTTAKLEETNNKNKDLFEKLKASELKVESLTALNRQKEQEVIEKVSIIEQLEDQITNSETKLKESKAQLRDTTDKVTEIDLALKTTIIKLEETQEKLKETEIKLTEFELKLIVPQTDSDTLGSGDVEAKLLDLRRNLEEERKAWTEERNQLMKQAEELKQQSSDELRDIYTLDPVLVHTIRTKVAEKEKREICGFTILGKELFVLSEGSSEVEVYDSMKLRFSRRWKLKELVKARDIVSCNRNKCLYIFNFKYPGQSNEILRLDPNGKLIKKWSTGNDDGWGLSVTDESNVILTVLFKNKLNEYSPDGQLNREINLSLKAGIHYPLHAIKLTNGHFLVSHGYPDAHLHGVCIVDAEGKLQKSFGGKPRCPIKQINLPFYLSVDGNGFVMVADQGNSRVLLLDSDLKFKREILSREKHGLRYPRRILLDESNNRLFAVDNELDSDGRILIFDFQ